ncbi:9110_t:CDS:2 [Entrophospora sp. SA101]|nr:9110_t:CDS:2 [Entrophospora sp. SA101]CAJ0922151.1 1633_t:CDS:2 [Entrophospora sp. SA101]
MERVYNERNNIFIDRNGKLFEYLRNDKLLKRIHDDKELLEDLLTEAEFFGINKLVNDIKSLIDPGIEKIHYHVVTTGIESLTYYRCPHGHDPERIGEGRYSSSNCRHTSVELVEDNVYFILIVTKNVPVKNGRIEKNTHKAQNNKKFTNDFNRTHRQTNKIKTLEALISENIKVKSDLDKKYKELEMLNNSIKNERDELTSLNITKETIVNELKMKKTKIAEQEKLVERLNAEFLEIDNIRRYLHNDIQDLKGNIRVFCRVRPQTFTEIDEPLAEIIYPNNSGNKKIVICSIIKNYRSINRNIIKEYEFDHVFRPESTQEQVYNELAHVVQSVVDGYNCCIFAYGQTGAGKTYTMQGSDASPKTEGMITRAFRHVFNLVNGLKVQGWTYTIEGQFIEIYNDQVYDLLQMSRGNVKITHDTEKGSTRITNVKTVNLESPNLVNQVLKSATKNRSIASTKMNDKSSRSHSIFMIHITGTNSNTKEKRLGSLNLIDLAGSEKISTFGSSAGDLQTETIQINKSLSSLKTVIKNIKDGNHINYLNISPIRSSQAETENSLEFGRVAKATHTGIAKKVKA